MPELSRFAGMVIYMLFYDSADGLKEIVMYIIDDICYAGTLVEGIKVIKVQSLRGRIMLITFSTGETRLLDTTLLRGTAFKVFDDEKIFSNPALFHGVITWDNGKVDIAPEIAYAESYAYSLPPSAAIGSGVSDIIAIKKAPYTGSEAADQQ